jgi:hypothetical protein
MQIVSNESMMEFNHGFFQPFLGQLCFLLASWMFSKRERSSTI